VIKIDDDDDYEQCDIPTNVLLKLKRVNVITSDQRNSKVVKLV
jgi:hypothetical protein